MVRHKNLRAQCLTWWCKDYYVYIPLFVSAKLSWKKGSRLKFTSISDKGEPPAFKVTLDPRGTGQLTQPGNHWLVKPPAQLVRSLGWSPNIKFHVLGGDNDFTIYFDDYPDLTSASLTVEAVKDILKPQVNLDDARVDTRDIFICVNGNWLPLTGPLGLAFSLRDYEVVNDEEEVVEELEGEPFEKP